MYDVQSIRLANPIEEVVARAGVDLRELGHLLAHEVLELAQGDDLLVHLGHDALDRDGGRPGGQGASGEKNGAQREPLSPREHGPGFSSSSGRRTSP